MRLAQFALIPPLFPLYSKPYVDFIIPEKYSVIRHPSFVNHKSDRDQGEDDTDPACCWNTEAIGISHRQPLE